MGVKLYEEEVFCCTHIYRLNELVRKMIYFYKAFETAVNLVITRVKWKKREQAIMAAKTVENTCNKRLFYRSEIKETEEELGWYFFFISENVIH